jgi:hypothetical protein
MDNGSRDSVLAPQLLLENPKYDRVQILLLLAAHGQARPNSTQSESK